MKLINWCLFVLWATVVWACSNNRLYEGYKNFPAKQWLVDSAAVFKFDVTDESKSYTLNYGIRHTIGYPYYNIYLDYTLKDITGKVLITKRIDNNLLDPKTGEPYGKGIGDLYDHEFIASQDFKFPKKGTYLVELKQAMRLDTLPEVVAVELNVVSTE
jgi:gliding motility-associated lipoprotein GldH